METKAPRKFTAAQAMDQAVLSQYVHKDKAYSVIKDIRCSPPYYLRTLLRFASHDTPAWHGFSHCQQQTSSGLI